MEIIKKINEIIDRLPKYNEEYLETNVRQDLLELISSIKCKPKKLSDLTGYVIEGILENPTTKKLEGIQVRNPENDFLYLVNKEKKIWWDCIYSCTTTFSSVSKTR